MHSFISGLIYLYELLGLLPTFRVNLILDEISLEFMLLNFCIIPMTLSQLNVLALVGPV